MKVVHTISLGIIGILVIVGIILIYLLYSFNYIPHKKYSNEYFGIETYRSTTDKDNDGIDDQTDILNSVRDYLETNPKYKSKYYAGGYPDDEFGVCTDVVAFGLKGAGYDLRELVYEDVLANREDYNIDIVDKNIDFRRVNNLKTFLDHNAFKLTNDIYQINDWQGGDVIVFDGHIGIVSNNRNKKGIAFIIHHANPRQRYYEEDILEYKRNSIVGHYRIS